MSKKRSQRNTKSFKKARARAGIPRQDLRSGGRVGAYGGGGAFGGESRKKKRPEPQPMGKVPTPIKDSTGIGGGGQVGSSQDNKSKPASIMAEPYKGPIDLPEYTDSERKKAMEDALGRGTVGPSIDDLNKRQREAIEAAKRKYSFSEKPPTSRAGPSKANQNRVNRLKDEMGRLSDNFPALREVRRDQTALMNKRGTISDAEFQKQSQEIMARGQKANEDFQNSPRFKEINSEVQGLQPAPQQQQSMQQIKEQVPEETRKEVENLEKVAVAQLEKDPKVQELKAKTQEIIDSGMSPEAQQQAMQSLAGEAKQVMQVAMQQPAMQQAVQSLSRSASPVTVEDKSTPAKEGEGGGEGGEDDGGGLVGNVLGAILDATVVVKDAAIGTGLSLAAEVIGKTGQVMDIMTGTFKKDTGQEALFRDAHGNMVTNDEWLENLENLEISQDNPYLETNNNELELNESGRVLDNDQSYIDTGPGSTGGTGDRGDGQGGSGSTIEVGDDGEAIVEDAFEVTQTGGGGLEQKPDDLTGGDPVDGDPPAEEPRDPTQPPDSDFRDTIKKSGEQLYEDDGSLALKREVETILKEGEDGTKTLPEGTITEEADIQKLATDDTAPKATATEVDDPTAITAETGEAAKIGFKEVTPEEMQKNWENSEAYKKAAEESASYLPDLKAKKKRLLARSKEIEGTGHPGYSADLEELNKKIAEAEKNPQALMEKSFKAWSENQPKEIPDVEGAANLQASKVDATTIDPDTLDKTEAAQLKYAPEGYSDSPPEGIAVPQVMPPEGKKFMWDSEGKRITVDADVKSSESITTEAVTVDSADEKYKTAVAEVDSEAAEAAKASTVTFDKSAESEVDRVDFRTGARGVTLEEYTTNWKASDSFKNLKVPIDPELAKIETSRNNLVAQLEAASDEEKAAIQEQIDALDAQTAQIKKDAEYKASDGNVLENETEGKAYEEWLNTQPKETYNVAPTPEAELSEREVITGEPAPPGTAAQIENYGFNRSMQRVVKGKQAKEMAAVELSEKYDLEPGVADKILEDAGNFSAEDEASGIFVDPDALGEDEEAQEYLGAVAALPPAALVSTQMENLMAGMEDGEIPAWARPAVAKIEQNMAVRGLSTSTVGRDSLFNAIIQSALPLAESNARAYQKRAEQNLNNEQQALIQDRNIAARFLEKNAEYKQQMEIANLSNEQQMRLANLESKNQAASEQLSSDDKRELANLQARLETNLMSAKIAENMGVALLKADQQRAVENARINANIDLAKFDNAAQTEFVNSKFAQELVAKDLDNKQRAALQDSANLAAMDMQAADLQTKTRIENARNFLAVDTANLNAEQQALLVDSQNKQQILLSNQSAENAAKQFNANSENQTNQFMVSMSAGIAKFNTEQVNSMEQFNTSEKNRIAALNADNQLEAEKINATIASEISRFNAQLESNREQWNAANAQAVEQSNVEWRRRANTIDTAAQNAANGTNVANAFGLSSRDSAFLWQELRDNMNKDFTRELTSEERQVAMINSAMQSETFLTDPKYSDQRDAMFSLMERILGIEFATGDPEDFNDSELTEEDAGSMGTGVDYPNEEENRKDKLGQDIE